MEKLEATFRIVTPMFIGGADQTPSDGIRPPSVKGALRFWWRALNWGRFYKKKRDENEALKALYEEEGRLFGLAAKTENGRQVGGQGKFLLTIRCDSPTRTDVPIVHKDFKDHVAARYLGYGLMVAFRSENKKTGIVKEAGQLERGCLNENQHFTVILVFREKVDESVLDALKVLGLLGGLGSRFRHGMGSIALEKIVCDEKEWTAPTTQEQYQTEVKEVIGDFSGVPQPDYSAFSTESRVDYLLSANSLYKALDEFGLRMLDYRSWGKTDRGNKLPSGKKSEENFKNDHDWYKNEIDPVTKKTWRKSHPGFHPERVVFGLPHNYDSKNGRYKVNAVTHERRASPLFFHVHRLSENKYLGVSVLMKSPFLPKDEKINAGGDHVGQNINKYKVIDDFLDGKVGNPPTKKDRFPDRKPVMP